MDQSGASKNQRLNAAAREDNESLLLEVFKEGDFDINHQDGLGNTALHYAASHGSTSVLERILSHEDCDVDQTNRIERATPLHLAVAIEDDDLRAQVVQSLLEAGANTSIQDSHGETPFDLVSPGDITTLRLFRKAQMEASVSNNDVASDDAEDGSSGSGSDE